MTIDLHSLNLLVKLIVLRRQILFSLAIAAIAEAIFMRTSAMLSWCHLYRVLLPGT